MIELINVGVRRNNWIFRDVSLTIPSGAKIGLVGKSGAGKSTLLKSICGLLSIQEGKISYQGRVMIGPDQKLIAGYEEIRFVDQEFALDPYHTVEENIREVVLFLPKDERDERVEVLLDLSELGSILKLKAHQISGGEKQRLALIRALAVEPEVLVLDEPFVHLDGRLKQKMMRYIDEIHARKKMTILIASHDGSELLGFVNELIHLRSGRIERIDDAYTFYYEPADKDEALLMGIVNEYSSNSGKLLFRPNEYILDDDGRLELDLIRARDMGLYVLNTFLLQGAHETIDLVSTEKLPAKVRISIRKRYE